MWVSVVLSAEICLCLFPTDPAPMLEASHSLEERLQQLQSLAPDSEALVREISGHWKKHLECLGKTGQPKIMYIWGQSGDCYSIYLQVLDGSIKFTWSEFNKRASDPHRADRGQFSSDRRIKPSTWPDDPQQHRGSRGPGLPAAELPGQS